MTAKHHNRECAIRRALHIGIVVVAIFQSLLYLFNQRSIRIREAGGSPVAGEEERQGKADSRSGRPTALLCTYMHTYRFQQENVRPSMRRVVVRARSFLATMGSRVTPPLNLGLFRVNSTLLQPSEYDSTLT